MGVITQLIPVKLFLDMVPALPRITLTRALHGYFREGPKCASRGPREQNRVTGSAISWPEKSDTGSDLKIT